MGAQDDSGDALALALGRGSCRRRCVDLVDAHLLQLLHLLLLLLGLPTEPPSCAGPYAAAKLLVDSKPPQHLLCSRSGGRQQPEHHHQMVLRVQACLGACKVLDALDRPAIQWFKAMASH